MFAKNACDLKEYSCGFVYSVRLVVDFCIFFLFDLVLEVASTLMQYGEKFVYRNQTVLQNALKIDLKAEEY